MEQLCECFATCPHEKHEYYMRTLHVICLGSPWASSLAWRLFSHSKRNPCTEEVLLLSFKSSHLNLRTPRRG